MLDSWWHSLFKTVKMKIASCKKRDLNDFRVMSAMQSEKSEQKCGVTKLFSSVFFWQRMCSERKEQCMKTIIAVWNNKWRRFIMATSITRVCVHIPAGALTKLFLFINECAFVRMGQWSNYRWNWNWLEASHNNPPDEQKKKSESNCEPIFLIYSHKFCRYWYCLHAAAQ